MNLQDIEQKVASLDLSRGFDFIYDLLRAYGIPKASISRLKSGTYDRSKAENEHLWKNKLYYRFAGPDEDLHALIDDAKNDERVMRERPRFLIVRDDLRLVAIDSREEVTLDVALDELAANASFFLPWAGFEKTQLESPNYADIKAAAKMAALYDEVIRHNSITTEANVHYLNVFFSRLLFWTSSLWEAGRSPARTWPPATSLSSWQASRARPARARLGTHSRIFAFLEGSVMPTTSTTSTSDSTGKPAPVEREEVRAPVTCPWNALPMTHRSAFHQGERRRNTAPTWRCDD